MKLKGLYAIAAAIFVAAGVLTWCQPPQPEAAMPLWTASNLHNALYEACQ